MASVLAQASTSPDGSRDELKCREHFGVRKMRIASAWIGYHEPARSMDVLGKLATFDTVGCFLVEEAPAHGNPDENDATRLVFANLGREQLSPNDIIVRAEIIHSARRTSDQVRESQPIVKQFHFFLGPQAFWHEPAFVHQAPEAISWISKIVPLLRRHEAGVNPDEQRFESRRENVRRRLFRGGSHASWFDATKGFVQSQGRRRR